MVRPVILDKIFETVPFGEADGFTSVFAASWAPLSRRLPPAATGGDSGLRTDVRIPEQEKPSPMSE